MFGKRCQLCGGKLSGSICQECGLDNSKNDSQYEKYFGTSQCDEGPLTHVHEEKKPKMEKTQKKILFHRSRSDKTVEKSYTQSNSGTYTDYTDRGASCRSSNWNRIYRYRKVWKRRYRCFELRDRKQIYRRLRTQPVRKRLWIYGNRGGEVPEKEKGTESRKWNQTEKDSGISGV